jgi:3-methyladenine DNA glycosylase/8-oxoguanine DNA glycosylase
MSETPRARPIPLIGFDCDADAAIAHLRAADPKLARIIDASGPCRMERKHTTSVFVALAEAIVYQQLSGKAAATIFGRVCDLFPGNRRGLNAKNLLAADAANLRGAGLSQNKMLALQDLAARTVAGEVPGLARLRRMHDEEIVATLTRVRGIGRWTAEMLLMFRLGRPDVLAADDLGLRQGHAFVIGRKKMTERNALLRYGERWRPYRSVASWYLWRAVELARRRVDV